MRITEIIENAKETLFSIEILPPLKGKDIKSLYAGIDPLMEFKPAFIDVTYHREEFILRKRVGGGFDKVFTRKRPGTVAICAALMNKYKVNAVPHLICGGFSKEETENALIDLNFLGIQNVLVLRGDSVKNEPNFVPEPDGNKNSLELLNQVIDMNNGVYLDHELENATPTNFCIGVSGYPEKHFEAPNMNSDLKWLKQKVDAGADYIVTQMFFDNKKFFDFVDRCRAMGITVPIIPGIKPMANKKQLIALPKIFHIDIPDDLVSAIENCKDDKAVKQVGIEWAIQQSLELKAAGVPVLHYYTMGLSSATKEIASKVF
ncbi:MAG: methylenetetrahydrofolate reductase [NAD(P)H] [Bacteroidia bacterium]|nr:methylenetetrahydrofolate reductase [NAD(P)H] [Bacteroidia bacterium]MCC7532574.1 methylenetetrahydrofolate reductase [NAD(P)H] [Bacteroidia bacterium]